MKDNTPQVDKYANLTVCEASLKLNTALLLMFCIYKLFALVAYDIFTLSYYEILTLVFIILGQIISKIYSTREQTLDNDTLSILFTTLSLVLYGTTTALTSNLLPSHKIGLYCYIALVVIVPFIVFSINKVGLHIDNTESEEGTNKSLAAFLGSIVGAILGIILIVVTNYYSKKYYNGTLTILVGSMCIALAGVYASVLAIDIKKLMHGA